MTDSYLAQFAQRAQRSGMDARYFEENRDKILEDARNAAVDSIRLFYLLEAIAREEKIEYGENDVEDKVLDFVLANATDKAE